MRWPLAVRIAKIEGFPHKLPGRLHNPGSLVYARQREAVLGERGFARFSDDEAGWRALERDLDLKIGRGMGLREIAYARCGPGDDPERYLAKLTGKIP